MRLVGSPGLGGPQAAAPPTRLGGRSTRGSTPCSVNGRGGKHRGGSALVRQSRRSLAVRRRSSGSSLEKGGAVDDPPLHPSASSRAQWTMVTTYPRSSGRSLRFYCRKSKLRRPPNGGLRSTATIVHCARNVENKCLGFLSFPLRFARAMDNGDDLGNITHWTPVALAIGAVPTPPPGKTNRSAPPAGSVAMAGTLQGVGPKPWRTRHPSRATPPLPSGKTNRRAPPWTQLRWPGPAAGAGQPMGCPGASSFLVRRRRPPDGPDLSWGVQLGVANEEPGLTLKRSAPEAFRTALKQDEKRMEIIPPKKPRKYEQGFKAGMQKIGGRAKGVPNKTNSILERRDHAGRGARGQRRSAAKMNSSASSGELPTRIFARS